MTRPVNSLGPSDNDRELGITRLTRIHGISRKTALAMYEIGIQNYTDLITYLNEHTTEEFSTALKGYGLKRGPGLIDKESWIKQAQILSQPEKLKPTSPKKEGKPRKEGKDSGRKPRDHDAVFTVSFDLTRSHAAEFVPSVTVYNEGDGGEEANFQGADVAPWVNWILERANFPSRLNPIPSPSQFREVSRPVEPALESLVEEHYDVLFEIGELQLSVIQSALNASEKRLEGAIGIRLSGTDAKKLTVARAPFRIDIYTIGLDNGFPRYVVSRADRFKPQVFEYSYKLDFAIPEFGHYEFHSLVRLLPSGELKAYHQGPALRVTP